MKTTAFFLLYFSLIFSIHAQECSDDIKQIEGLWENLTIENALNDPESLTSGFDAAKGNLTKSLGGLSLKGNTPKILSSKGTPPSKRIKRKPTSPMWLLKKPWKSWYKAHKVLQDLK